MVSPELCYPDVSKPGEWLLVIATGVSLVLLWLDVRDAPEGSGKGLGRLEDAAGDEWRLFGMDPP